MFFSNTFIISASLMLAASVSAQFDPNRPFVFSGDQLSALGNDLYNRSPSHKATSKAWDAGWIPQYCYSEAVTFGFNPADFEVRNVKFDDCSASWALCRHKNAAKSWATIEDTLGRVPVGMRQYLANAVIFPDPVNLCARAFFYQLSTSYSSGCFELGVIVHELTHILDANALPQLAPGTLYSLTDHFNGAYQKDTYVPTDYARSSFVEDFADVGRISLSEWAHRGILQQTNSNTNKIANQLGNFENRLYNIVYAPKQCTAKVDTTKAVRMSDGSSARSAKFAPLQVGSLEGSDVPEIPKPENGTELHVVYRGPKPLDN